MTLRIVEDLTEPEKLYLKNSYGDDHRAYKRMVRLSIQYALGAGIFVYLCISHNEPLYVLPVYGTFVVFLIIRIIGASKAGKLFRSIVTKYEAKLQDLPEK